MQTTLFSLVALVMLLSLIFLLWFIISLLTSYSHRSYQGFLFTSPENHVIIIPGLVFLATVIQLMTHVTQKTGLLETLTKVRKESKAACASDVLTLVCWSHSPKSGLIIDNNPDITRLLYCLPVTSRARANICTFGIYWLDQTSATRASHKDVDNEDWGALNAAWPRPLSSQH